MYMCFPSKKKINICEKCFNKYDINKLECGIHSNTKYNYCKDCCLEMPLESYCYHVTKKTWWGKLFG